MFDGLVHRSTENGFVAESGTRVWLLKRNCALSPQQVVRFYLSMLALSALIASGFAWVGAWMVLPFAGLEMLAMGVALFIYARHATDHERVVLEQGQLKVEAMVAGKQTVTLMNPYWARVEIQSGRKRREVRRGMAKVGVVLLERDRCVAVGRYVSEERRRVFAQELKYALSLAWSVGRVDGMK